MNGPDPKPLHFSVNNSETRNILYISYDGMTDPLGRSQVLPYLTGLASLGHRFRLISLEKPSAFAAHGPAVQQICDASGIAWHPRKFRRGALPLNLPLNLLGLLRGARHRHAAAEVDIIHCRSDLAGLVGLTLQRPGGPFFLYDMRAFWPDERAEGGAWDQRKWLFRKVFAYFKTLQARLIARADHIVILSQTGRRELEKVQPQRTAPITVIPCCADFAHFHLSNAAERSSARAELDIPAGAPLLIHLGTLGCNALLGEMMDFFAAYRARHPGAFILFLTPTPDDEALVAEAASMRQLADVSRVRSATREQVPKWLSAADIGLFFVRPTWSKTAASPTKMAEMLASGLPTVSNAGVGDVADVLARTGAGVTVNKFHLASYQDAIDQLDALNLPSADIRARALAHFNVDDGIARYDNIYSSFFKPIPCELDR